MEQLTSLPDEVRDPFLSQMQNDPTPEQLKAALQAHPELLPVLAQMMGQSASSNSNVP